jgi:hypothetical protein
MFFLKERTKKLLIYVEPGGAEENSGNLTHQIPLFLVGTNRLDMGQEFFASCFRKRRFFLGVFACQ